MSIDIINTLSKIIQRVVLSISLLIFAISILNISKRDKTIIEKEIHHYTPSNQYDYYENKTKGVIDSIRALPRKQQDSIYNSLADEYINIYNFR
jgi:hypothetical protein